MEVRRFRINLRRCIADKNGLRPERRPEAAAKHGTGQRRKCKPPGYRWAARSLPRGGIFLRETQALACVSARGLYRLPRQTLYPSLQPILYCASTEKRRSSFAA